MEAFVDWHETHFEFLLSVTFLSERKLVTLRLAGIRP